MCVYELLPPNTVMIQTLLLFHIMCVYKLSPPIYGNDLDTVVV